VLGDYMQTGGDFRVFAAGNFDVDGTFSKMGTGLFEIVIAISKT
jgi:hypothetical protein